jgi:hypothetical protein
MDEDGTWLDVAGLSLAFDMVIGTVFGSKIGRFEDWASGTKVAERIMCRKLRSAGLYPRPGLFHERRVVEEIISD